MKARAPVSDDRRLLLPKALVRVGALVSERLEKKRVREKTGQELWNRSGPSITHRCLLKMATKNMRKPFGADQDCC